MVGKIRLLTLICTTALAITACSDGPGAKYVGLAKCLTQKNAKMYGTYWCSHCANQKKMFGRQAFKEINYIECDPRGGNAKPGLCLEKNIKGYPTWEFNDGSRTEGEAPLAFLAEKTGCALPEEVSSPN